MNKLSCLNNSSKTVDEWNKRSGRRRDWVRKRPNPTRTNNRRGEKTVIPWPSLVPSPNTGTEAPISQLTFAFRTTNHCRPAPIPIITPLRANSATMISLPYIHATQQKISFLKGKLWTQMHIAIEALCNFWSCIAFLSSQIVWRWDVNWIWVHYDTNKDFNCSVHVF